MVLESSPLLADLKTRCWIPTVANKLETAANVTLDSPDNREKYGGIIK